MQSALALACCCALALAASSLPRLAHAQGVAGSPESGAPGMVVWLEAATTQHWVADTLALNSTPPVLIDGGNCPEAAGLSIVLIDTPGQISRRRNAPILSLPAGQRYTVSAALRAQLPAASLTTATATATTGGPAAAGSADGNTTTSAAGSSSGSNATAAFRLAAPRPGSPDLVASVPVAVGVEWAALRLAVFAAERDTSGSPTLTFAAPPGSLFQLANLSISAEV